MNARRVQASASLFPVSFPRVQKDAARSRSFGGAPAKRSDTEESLPVAPGAGATRRRGFCYTGFIPIFQEV